MVVLNQADRLTAAEVAQCRADLVRLMERDGVPRATVLATSVTTGDGLDELHQRLANAVAGRTMTRARLAGDVRAAAGALHRARRRGRARGRRRRPRRAARRAGPQRRGAHRGRGRRARLPDGGGRAAPAGRSPGGCSACVRDRCAGCGSTGATSGSTDADVRSVLGRSSLPPPSPAARAAVDLATRRLADRASASLPHPWADAVERAADPPGPALGDALDRAVVGTSLLARVPIWWRVVGLVQLAAGGRRRRRVPLAGALRDRRAGPSSTR